ncbi:acyl-CoA synthetase [Lactobacillus nasalidis]|uniref:Acyl-CoA synthetase n=1 Tax=Lactobacillus nasalidis TaxID=2797258 RepID=A0ABQ3W2C8_9LACO|nr:AMP-binding protein [Lactobacillus nasalidis]GHV96959.1 acyl-CoA synthetase [Lactobacillus nasalidis]GHV99895.1 acyl-CoA synthetase [Lactobacillus nasalidis]GHW00428.1 acyl-CoA synthetase [Lactobacillus nasalidis]
MTRLTTDLQANIQKNQNRNILMDLSRHLWFTGQDIEDDVAVLQKCFRASNLAGGDRVLMRLANSPVYIPINQAMWRMGITPHPVSASTPARELLRQLDELEYPALLVDQQMADEIDLPGFQSFALNLKTMPDLVFFCKPGLAAGRSCEPTEESLGLILSTSGTTGKPKQVGLTHAMMRAAAQYDKDSHRLTPDDTVLVVMPMFHINAQMILTTSSLLAGGRIAIAPKFSASRFWGWVHEADASWSSIVPTIVMILLKNENALAAYKANPQNRLRFIRCASAMLPVARHKQFLETYHVPLLEGYGMTESCSQCTLNPLDAIKIGSAGKPYHTEMAIFADGKYHEYGKESNVKGEICIKGHHVITHYLSGSQKDFQNGWFHTGDLGYFDEDGYLWLEGRIKHLINRGGEKVSPIIVENVISELPFVKAVAVVPTPDEFYGEVVTAAIVLDPRAGIDPQQARQQIDEHCRKNLASYRCPSKIFFVDQFPLNPTGKIKRPELAAELVQLEKQGA